MIRLKYIITLLCTTLLFMCSPKSYTQNTLFPFALSDVYKERNNTINLKNHPASLLSSNSLHYLSLGTYVQGRFIKENNEIGFVSAYRFKNNAIGLNYNYSGFAVRYENEIGLTYARKFWDDFSIGLNATYVQFNKIEDRYGDALLDLNLSLAYNLNNKWAFILQGLYPINISSSAPKLWNKALYLRLAAAYLINEDLCIGAEIAKDLRYPIEFEFSVSYRFVKRIIVFYANNVYPFENKLGIAYSGKHIDIELCASYQNKTGFSSSIAFLWKTNFNK